MACLFYYILQARSPRHGPPQVEAFLRSENLICSRCSDYRRQSATSCGARQFFVRRLSSSRNSFHPLITKIRVLLMFGCTSAEPGTHSFAHATQLDPTLSRKLPGSDEFPVIDSVIPIVLARSSLVPMSFYRYRTQAVTRSSETCPNPLSSFLSHPVANMISPKKKKTHENLIPRSCKGGSPNATVALQKTFLPSRVSMHFSHD